MTPLQRPFRRGVGVVCQCILTNLLLLSTVAASALAATRAAQWEQCTATAFGIPPAGASTSPQALASLTGNNFPTGVSVDPRDNTRIWYTLTWDHTVYASSSGAQEILVAGTGTAGYSGDGGYAVNAQLNSPSAVLVRQDGTVFVVDQYNHAIRAMHVP